MEINFYPDSDKDELVKASNQYTQIWYELGTKIIGSYKEITGLNFLENEINAIIFEKPSFSHPLTLRASYSSEVKKGTLVHELGHRLIVGNGVEVDSPKENFSLDIHKQLFLILFDVWEKLFNLQFAKTMVMEERKRGVIYQDAWNWVLSLDKEKRKQLFNSSMKSKTFS